MQSFYIFLFHLFPFILLHRRIGVQEGSTRCIIDHPFFANIDSQAVHDMTLVPQFIPAHNNTHDPLSNLMPVKPFNGDQHLFAEF